MPRLAVTVCTLFLASALAAQGPPNLGSAKRVEVRNVRLDESAGVPSEVAQDIAARIRDYRYRADSHDGVLEIVREVLQEHCYFKATVSPFGYKTISETPDLTVVDAAVVVDSGSVYYLASIEFTGNTAFSAP